MILVQQLRKVLVTISLVILVAITIAFEFGTPDSWATPLHTQFRSPPQSLLASMNRAKALKQDVEGKAQEAIGNITGNPKDQIMGKAKQVGSQAQNSVENVKDNLKLKGRTKAVAKNLEGKFEEAKGKATGDRKAQLYGKAKQVESQARNTVEDVKNKVRDIIN